MVLVYIYIIIYIYANMTGVNLDGIHVSIYIAAPWIRHGYLDAHSRVPRWCRSMPATPKISRRDWPGGLGAGGSVWRRCTKDFLPS